MCKLQTLIRGFGRAAVAILAVATVLYVVPAAAAPQVTGVRVGVYPAKTRIVLDVSGSVKFGFADAQQMLPVVWCSVMATIDATCQRCLEAFRLPLEVEERLLLLELEETADGYDEYEVWELDDASLCPQDIVEELLIMAVPFSAMHTESAACRVLAPVEEQAEEDMTTPFAALREQMAKDNEGSA